MARPNAEKPRHIKSEVTGRTLYFYPISQYFRNKLYLASQQTYKHDKPTPPVYFNEVAGKDMPNPYDPEYQDALAKWNEKVNGELIVSCFIFATRHTVKELDIKRALEDLEHDQFTADLEDFNQFLADQMSGVDIPSNLADQLYQTRGGESPIIRYIVDYIFARHTGDIEKLLNLLQPEVVMEEAVQDAIDSFPSDVQGEVNLEIHSAV